MFIYGNFCREYLEEQSGEEGQSGAGGAEYTPPSQSEWAAMQKQVAESADSTSAMQIHLNKLLGETKKAKEEKRLIEETTRLSEAKKSQSMEDFEKELRAQHKTALGGKISEIENLNKIILGGANKSALTELAGLFESPEAGMLMLQNMVKSEHGENGVVTNFNGLDGALVTTDKKTMCEWLKNNKVFQPYLKGVGSSGGMDGSGKPAASGGQGKEMERSEFEKLAPAKQMTIIKSGVKIK